MKGFKKLVIENFQSHVRTEIDFVPGLNVFVGPSDSGKSAILRALRWVLFNIPRGFDFKRTGADRCQVTLTLADGTQIVRVRSNSVNRYILVNPEGKEQVFEGFGNSVPQEVLDAHQMKPLKLDQKWEMIVHFGSQLDGPFLLSESNIAKAKIIGSISGAQIIDRALKGTAQDRKHLSRQMKQLEEQVAQLEQELTPYENLPQLEESLTEAQTLYQEAKRKQARLSRLRQLLKSYQQIQEEKESQHQIVKRLESVTKIEQKYLEIEWKALQRNQLNQLYRRWSDNQLEIKNCQVHMEQTKQLPLAETSFGALQLKKEKLSRLVESKKKWEQVQRSLNQVKKQLDDCQHVPVIQQLVLELVRKADRLRALIEKQEQWQKFGQIRQKVDTVMNSTREIPHLSEQVTEIDVKLSRLQQLAKLYDEWLKTKERIRIGEEYYLNRKKEIEQLTNEYVALLKEQGTCPTCGTQVNSSKLLEHLLEEYLV
ncbi:AAA family ATPase [Thermoflavimicrobium dichotomicum]|uniref:Nuclease SbcCD subunit C n=1 Tax=Thermoflavimicrobium dichotomicum TaxID=46223 RepID=A0A1I3PUS3_9BACL|nr:AAA family ATPase [Thermoflavimicrobium dichotomicum]SFJ24971.1 exonuclease SbcC [Thermoflavimicrobium dichotomicum]